MVPSKFTNAITLVGGGDETFDELERGISELAQISLEFVAGTLSATTTITLQVKYGSTWITLNSSAGDPRTGTVASDGTLAFSNVDVQAGAQVRPIFETDATGPITVITWA